ncbi:MAG: rRNA maturation RNase YbeY [Bacillota bacterium]|nr:rRNA maturation RNase YbeY [Bacillota bacterium]
MKLLLENEVNIEGFDEIIEKAVLASLKEQKMTEDCEVSVTLCGNDEIAQLNSEYMHREGPTDVLSFPMLSFDESGNIIPESIDYDEELIVLGDIVISVERAGAQAEEYGHSLIREIGFLTVHSMLHLLGFDHMEEEDMYKMQTKEKIILEAINLPRE